MGSFSLAFPIASDPTGPHWSGWSSGGACRIGQAFSEFLQRLGPHPRALRARCMWGEGCSKWSVCGWAGGGRGEAGVAGCLPAASPSAEAAGARWSQSPSFRGASGGRLAAGPVPLGIVEDPGPVRDYTPHQDQTWHLTTTAVRGPTTACQRPQEALGEWCLVGSP